jgi:hypothetical protein
MSTLNLALGRLEALGDHCNAIVVKEVRQALKSRQFVGTFVLLLLVAWGGSIFGISMTGDSIEYGSSAEGFFVLFYMILCVASLVIVPFGAFRSIVEERAENTLELVQITALSPRQIVWGKSLSALVQVLVYFSAITPFIAFTSLLPGFDFIHTLFALGMLLVASFAYSSVALAIGAQTKTRFSQSFGALGVIVLALIGLFIFSSLFLRFVTFIALGEPATWWGIGIAVFIALSTSYLCQQVAIAQLTFESDNRSSGIRLTVTAQWLVGWLAILGFVAFFGRLLAELNLFVMVLLTSIYVTVAGLYVIAEPEGLSRRVARGLPRAGWLRAIWVPFLPGGTRGLLFGLGSIAVMAIMALSAVIIDSKGSSHFDSNAKEWSAAIVVVCYAVIYLCAGAWLTRLFRRVMTNFSPGHLIALLLLCNLLLVLVEFLWHFLTNFRDDTFQAIDIVFPIITVSAILGGHGSLPLPEIEAGIVAVILLAMNGRAMVRAAREVLDNPVRAQIELEVARRNQTAPAAAESVALETGAVAS